MTITLILMAITLLLGVDRGSAAPRVVDFSANPYEEVGKLFDVPPWLLYGIAKVESNLNPFAINHRGKAYHFKTYREAANFLKKVGGNVDVGLGQINCAIWKSTLRVECSDLLNPWLNLSAMAFVLKRLMKKQKKDVSFWNVVARYHSSNRVRGRRYAWRVYRVVSRMFSSKRR